MTVVVNLFGGPGSGKSSAAAGVFAALKTNGVSCELVQEYAKDKVWEGSLNILEHQNYVFAQQLHRQWRLMNKVKYIITDSPILLSCVYFEHWFNKHPGLYSERYKDACLNYFTETFFQFDNENWYITRNKPYVMEGRLQTEEEAWKLDDRIYHLVANQALNMTDSLYATHDISQSILVKEGVLPK
jgi:hypothetical protein